MGCFEKGGLRTRADWLGWRLGEVDIQIAGGTTNWRRPCGTWQAGPAGGQLQTAGRGPTPTVGIATGCVLQAAGILGYRRGQHISLLRESLPLLTIVYFSRRGMAASLKVARIWRKLPHASGANLLALPTPAPCNGGCRWTLVAPNAQLG